MFCGKCGSAIPDGDSFCKKCGAPISDSSELSSFQTVGQPVQPTPVVIMTQPTQNKRANGAAIAGFVLGLLSCIIPYVGVVLGIIGLILSIVGLVKKNSCHSGGGFAIAGLILSILSFFMASILALGMQAYLKKAQAAASQSSYESSTIDPFVDQVNKEIDEVLG